MGEGEGGERSVKVRVGAIVLKAQRLGGWGEGDGEGSRLSCTVADGCLKKCGVCGGGSTWRITYQNSASC